MKKQTILYALGLFLSLVPGAWALLEEGTDASVASEIEFTRESRAQTPEQIQAAVEEKLGAEAQAIRDEMARPPVGFAHYDNPPAQRGNPRWQAQSAATTAGPQSLLGVFLRIFLLTLAGLIGIALILHYLMKTGEAQKPARP